MDKYRVLEIKRSIFDDNDSDADLLRETLKSESTFLLNLMSSPGSGKTSVLLKTVAALKDELKLAVMEADIDGECDAQTLAQQTGVKVIQLHTGGMCHLDADMTRQGIKALDADDADLVFLENVGNLVCPAEFDTGSSKNAMILSVPEGDDKPLKYPLMFTICDVVLINKMDTLSVFDFNLDKCTQRIHELNPNALVIPISAKSGEGMEGFYDWLKNEVKAWKE